MVNEQQITATDGSPTEPLSSAARLDTLVRREEADNLIKGSVIASMSVGMIPLPLVDVAGFIGVQLWMLRRLSGLYQVPFARQRVKAAVGALLGGVFPLGPALPLVASAVKLIPGAGWVVGMISMSILGGAATYAVGRVFSLHFEAGGTLLDFDPHAMRGYFQRELEAGKGVAQRLRETGDSAS